MSKQEHEFHPYAAVVPMLGQPELNALAADIQGHGLREDIILLDGKILDGRNRYKACRIAGVAPRFRDFNGDGDPIAFIVSKNLCRRQLTASQKALAVAKIADLPRGNPNLNTAKTPTKPNSAQMRNKTVAEVAKEVEVSPRTVEQAKQVLREAPKETVEKVERGEKSVSTAVKEIKAAKQTPEKHFDKTGYPIPDAIFADWRRAAEYNSTLRSLHVIKLDTEKRLDESDLIFREIGKDTLIELQNAWSNLKSVLPYAVCPTCQGRNRDKCTVCKGRGWVSEFGYKNWFPKKTIELREKAIKK